MTRLPHNGSEMNLKPSFEAKGLFIVASLGLNRRTDFHEEKMCHFQMLARKTGFHRIMGLIR